MRDLAAPPASEPDVTRSDVQFRFRSHVHEFICPATPDRDALGASSVFAGGGITNCPDWQVRLADLVNERIAALADERSLSPDEATVALLNPRRSNFPIGDPAASQFQISWEHRYLHESKAIAFWNPKDTEGPITLFETGKWMMSAKPIFLGIEPGFARTEELLAHVNAVRPGLTAARTLEQHADNIARWVLGIGRSDSCHISGHPRARSLYLAGGIKDCADWQAEISSLLSSSQLSLENPRLQNFVRGDAAVYRALVRSNRLKLDSCESALVWFPKEHLTPIALLELGSLAASSKPLFVGVEPGYKRQVDVEIQLRLARPEIDIVYSIGELAQQVRRYYAMR